MTNTPATNSEDFVKQVMQRIREIDTHALHLTNELGLPPTAKGAILKGLYDPAPSAVIPIAQFRELTPSSIELSDKVVIVGQALDNQWGPRPDIDRMFANSLSRGDDEAFPSLDRATRAEFRRSLINGEAVVVNRAYFVNNPSLFSHYTPESPDREAFIGLLQSGSIVPYLIWERRPDELPSNFTLHSQGSRAWEDTAREATGMQCLRLSWDDDRNKELTANLLARRFHDFSRSLRGGNSRQFMADLGLGSILDENKWYDIAKLLDETASVAGDERRRRGGIPLAAREDVYRVFVSTNPGQSLYDGGALLADDPHKALEGTHVEAVGDQILRVRAGIDPRVLRQAARGIKELADLSYSSTLPDAIGGYSLTPRDSLQRRSLQEFQVALQQAHSFQRPLEFEQLVELIQREAFSLISTQLQPVGLETLSLSDVQRLRETDEWREYIKALHELIAVAPLSFEQEAKAVYRTYARMLDRLPQGNVSWTAEIGVALNIAGITLNFMWVEGMVLVNRFGNESDRMKEGNAPVTARLMIGNGLNNNSWTSGLDFLSAGIAHPFEVVKQLENYVDTKPGYQRGDVFWHRREATINAGAA